MLAFEKALRADPDAVPDRFLTGTGAARAGLLVELLHSALELGLRAGRDCRTADLLARYPELGDRPDDLAALLETELRGRARAGQTPDPAAYESTLAALGPRVREAFVRAGLAPPAVPGYELLGELGRGGMGVVYRGRDPALDRPVAVKVLRPGLPPGSDAARRFEREARVTARLQHPGVPAVHHAGRLADGRPYLAMRLVEGQTLARLAVGRADPGRLAAAFEAVCQTVGYAHSRGVIHRDLKPQNVIVGAFGEVQVMDWGLAKVLAEGDPAGGPGGADSPSMTLSGSVLGTPGYMAPEQAAGRGDRADARSDVYGLGGILYVLLTGHPPGDRWGGRPHPHLDGCRADPELVALCRRCLAADPAGRPADGGAVAEAVGRLRAAADDRARQAERRAAAAQARRRWRAAAVAGVVLASVAGAAVSWSQVVRARAAEGRADRRTATIGRLADPFARLLGAQALAAGGLARPAAADRERLTQDLADAMGALGEVSPDDPAVPPATRRALANIAYLLADRAGAAKRPADADRLMAEAARWYEAAAAQDPADADTRNQWANSLYLLGAAARDAKRPADARALWERSAAVSQALARDRPEVAGFRENLGRTYYNQAMLAIDDRRPDDARRLLDQAVDTLKPVVRPGQPGAWFLAYAYRHRADRHPKGSAEKLADVAEAVRWAPTANDRKDFLDGLDAELPAGPRLALARAYAVAAAAAGPKSREGAGHLARALGVLGRCPVTAADCKAVRADPDFAPVRRHPDFPALDARWPRSAGQ